MERLASRGGYATRRYIKILYCHLPSHNPSTRSFDFRDCSFMIMKKRFEFSPLKYHIESDNKSCN